MKKLIYILFLFPCFLQAQIDSAVKQIAKEETARQIAALSVYNVDTATYNTVSTAMVSVQSLTPPLNKTAIYVLDVIASGALGSRTAKKEVSVQNKNGVYSIIGDYNIRPFTSGTLPAIWQVKLIGGIPVLQIGNCIASWKIYRQIII